MTNCFELYGLDFLLDEEFNVSLLEVNPGPDFKQTGGRLRSVITELWERTSELVFDNPTKNAEVNVPNMIKVYDNEWSVSKMSGGMSFN